MGYSLVLRCPIKTIYDFFNETLLSLWKCLFFLSREIFNHTKYLFHWSQIPHTTCVKSFLIYLTEPVSESLKGLPGLVLIMWLHQTKTKKTKTSWAVSLTDLTLYYQGGKYRWVCNLSEINSQRSIVYQYIFFFFSLVAASKEILNHG